MAYQERLSGLISNANFSSTTGWTTSAFTTVGTSYRSSSSAGRGSSSSGSGSAEQTVDISSSTHLDEIDAGTAQCLVAYAQAYSRAGGGVTDDPGNKIACTATFLDGNAVLGASPTARDALQQSGLGDVELTRSRRHRKINPLRPGPHQRRHHEPVRRRLRALALRGGATGPRPRLQARVLYSGSLTGAVRVSRAAVEVLRTLGRRQCRRDQLHRTRPQPRLRGPAGQARLGRGQRHPEHRLRRHQRRQRPAWRQLVRPGAGLDHAGAPHPQGDRPHGLGHRRPDRPRPRRRRALGLSRLEQQPGPGPARAQLLGQPARRSPGRSRSAAITSRRRSTAPAGHQRTTGLIDVPAGARWLRLGWGCPVSTSTQYACADDLVLSVITDSEPGAGGGAGTYVPCSRFASEDRSCARSTRSSAAI